MKKFLITLLAVFYLGVSSGATVHFHYCMGELIDWGVSQEKSLNSETCSNCGMIKGNTDNCCKDKDQEIKVKDSLKVASSSFMVKVFAFEPLLFPDLAQMPLPVSIQPHLSGDTLLRPQKTSLFLRNCNFRI